MASIWRWRGRAGFKASATESGKRPEVVVELEKEEELNNTNRRENPTKRVSPKS